MNMKPWLDNFMFIITLQCSKLWIWMGIYFRDILLIRIPIIVSNVYLRKTFFKMIFPWIILIIQWKFRFLWVLNKWSKGLTMQINFHSLLWSYLSRVPIFLAMTVCIYIYISAVKWLIASKIKIKCLHKICVYCVYLLCIYKYKQMHVFWKYLHVYTFL